MATAQLEKSSVISCIQDMPQLFTIDELFEKIIILARIKSSETQISNGNFYTKEQTKELVSGWLKK